MAFGYNTDISDKINIYIKFTMLQMIHTFITYFVECHLLFWSLIYSLLSV